MRTLKNMWERTREVPSVRRNFVIVLATLMIGIAATAYFFGRYDWIAPWEERVQVVAEFEKAPSVRPESRQEVRIAGVTVGRITSTDLMPNGNARVEMSLEPGRTVYSNARAVLRSKAPLNIMYVALDPGGRPGTPLPPGGVIPVTQTERPRQPFELLDKLNGRAQSALTSLINEADAALVSAPAQLPGGLRATDAAIGSFRPVMEQLAKRRENIEQLVTSLAHVSTAIGQDDRRLTSLTASLQETLSVLAKRDAELGDTLEQIPGLSGDLKHTMAKTSELTEQLDPTLDALHGAADELPNALSRMSKMAESANTFVDAAGPVVHKAKPVVADLRPLASDVDAALRDLSPVTRHLPSATTRIVPWMDDLAAFVYQTSSAFSVSDVNGGFGRANVLLDVSDPSGGQLLPGVGGSGKKAGN